MQRQPKPLYEFGPFRLDVTRRSLQREGAVVPLTSKTFDVLLALIESATEVVEKDDLMRRVWPDSIVEEVNLAYHISLLRKALGERRNERNYIVTVPGRGYSFVAPVKMLEMEELKPVAQAQNGFPASANQETSDENQRADEDGNKSDYRQEPTVEVREARLIPPVPLREQATDETGEEPATNGTPEERSTVGRAEQGLPKLNRPRVWILLAMCTVLAGGIAVGWYKLNSKEKPTVPSALKITKLTTTGKARYPAISPDGKYVAFIAFEVEGASLWIRQMATASTQPLIPASGASYQGLAFSPDGNYLYYAAVEKGGREVTLYQMPALGGAARKVLTNIDGLFALSPDGQQVAFVRDEHALILANLDGTGERILATRPASDSLTAVAWSPDGKKVACAAVGQIGQGMDAELLEIETASGAQKTLTRHWNWIRQVAWLPDNSGLMMLANDKQGSPSQLWQVSYPDGEVRRITTDLNSYNHLSLTADASALVMTQSDQSLNLWVVPGVDGQGARQITFGSAKEGYSGLDWTPDGKIVYSSFASGRPEIWMMEADGSQRKQLTFEMGSDRLGLSVSPDGRYIAFVPARGDNYRGGPGGIWRMNIDGGSPKQLTKVGNLPLFTPDRQWVFYRVDQAVWKVPVDGGEALPLTGPYARVIDFSPDGKLFAYWDEATKKVGIVSSDGSKPSRILPDIPLYEQRPLVRWTYDGQALSYLVTREGVSNVWRQPIDGSPPKQVTDFKTERIHYYAWSRDGQRLAVARGSADTDVVMLSNFRSG